MLICDSEVEGDGVGAATREARAECGIEGQEDASGYDEDFLGLKRSVLDSGKIGGCGRAWNVTLEKAAASAACAVSWP